MYIVLEGIVGSGKSTQVRKLVEYLSCHSGLIPESRFLPSQEWRKRGVLSVREPGSTLIAEDIRHLAQKKEWENEDMHPLTNAYLYAAARTQTLQTIVKPALEKWNIVISDRSFLSSLAQQGYTQWLGIERILEINREAMEWVFPDIVLYLDISADIALSRIFDEYGDKWEKMGKEFFESIIYGYEECEKLEIMKNRFIRVDASGDEDEVFRRILEKLKIQD